MSPRKPHEIVVGEQFGPRARQYLSSAVHANGPDLEALAGLVKGAKTARVLDLGCGAGHVSFLVAPHVSEIVSYDLSAEMLAVVSCAGRERGLANITTQQGVAEELPFANQSFDYVVSRYSAHHWRDLEAGLREVARVLRPDGVAGFVDAVSPGVPVLDTFLQTVELLRDPSHVRDYARPEWECSLVRSGLKPQAVVAHKVRLEFDVWTERMRTPKGQVDAIRAVQAGMADTVREYFKIGPDGSFDLDVAFIHATRMFTP